ncbi:primosomal protein N' [Candidatus Phytoplasma ziziphi]|uniref:Replication restart protein PriA n=1 Tax=Ziziphus jujuba witches'-broom phytoplasma TaxID=135727 RepID=A0A660HMF7_ZIZJU|nr:primosomal protein N' [Candidatus Phytoplasma ziziphi]AYJ01217.1 primosomal protein N' [Candidatus Phytoplasma ziziphi]
MLYAEVIVDNKIPNLSQCFDYLIPEYLVKIAQRGMRVIVPFGNKNTERLGYILKLKEITLVEPKYIKSIIEILDDIPFLNEEFFLLAEEILKIPFINPALAYNTIMPRSFLSTYIRQITIIKEKELNKEIKEYLIKKKGILSLKDIVLSTEELFKLQKKEIIKTKIIISKKDYRPSIEPEIIKHKNEIILNFKNTFCLNEKQDLIWKQISWDGYKNYLLYYDCYEDKIAIYLKLIEKTLQQNKQVLILVPEILLISFLKEQIKKYFPEILLTVLTYESDYKEHYQKNQDIQENKIFIVMGTRKVIFAPLKKIGVIIFDEENDESLIEKDKSPNYDSKELAYIRSRYHKIPLIFFTTMPSIESYCRLKQKKIIFLNLTHKNKQKMQLIDMKEELKKGNVSPLSSVLLEYLQKNIKEKKKTILFINILGFSPFVLCRFCSYIPKCKKCYKNLIFVHNQFILKCTYCHYTEKFSSQCPSCLNKSLKHVSLGIEYISLFLKKQIPSINFVSIDSNDIKKITQYQKILQKLEDNKIDLLLGTEMIAKNLKLPSIETIGILMADVLLNIPNFKATEKTFQLLMKLSNYLSEKGKMIIQGYNTNHLVLQKAQYYDVFSFLEQTLKDRKLANIPPFCFYSKILISHSKMFKVLTIANKIKKILENNLIYKIIVLGPTYPCVFHKDKNYRILLTLKYYDWPLNLNFIIEQNLNEDAFILFDRFASII